MSIASRIEAIEQHLTDDYSVLTLAGADLTNVDKNILNLKQTWQERLLYFMNNGTQQVWDNWSKTTGTGTTLTLNNTEEAPMSLVYKGNTQQSGTPTPDNPIPIQVVSGDNNIVVCGKNLWNEQWENGYYNRTTGAKGTGNTYIRSVDYIPVKPSSTIYFNKPSDFINYAVIFYDSTKTITGALPAPARTLSAEIGVPSTASYFTFYGDTGVANATYKNNVIITYGNSSTTYEAYTGESYPISLGDIELCKIGDYQDKIDKSTGKNLFDNTTITSGQFVNQYGNMGTDATAFVSDYIEITPNTDYYISGRTTWNSVGLYDSSKTFIERPNYTATGILNITNTNVKYIRINASATDINTLMINLGSTPLPYEPYGTGWYVKKEIGKVVLNGSENWNKRTATGNSYGGIYIQDCSAVWGTKTSYTNYFTYNVENAYNGTANGYGIDGNGQVMIGYPNMTSLADFKTWLGTHNLIVYYRLKTPTYTLIEDSTLIEELESMKKSKEGQTNISQVNNDMPFILDITALSKE